MVLTVKTSRGLSETNYIYLPNGTGVYGNNIEYVVTKNGIYGFAVRDNYGNMNYAYYEVKNIDTTSPSVTITAPDGWTREDATIELNVINK